MSNKVCTVLAILLVRAS